MKRTGLLLAAAAAVAMIFVCVVVAFGRPDEAKAFSSSDPGKVVFLSTRDISKTPCIQSEGDNCVDIYTMNPDGSDVRRITDETTGTGEEQDPVLSPNGSKIAFKTWRGPVRIINTDGSGLVSIPGSVSRYGVASPSWSPDGSKLAYTNYLEDNGGQQDIFVVNSDLSGQPVNITNTPASYERYPDWSPDGKRLAFSCLRCPGDNGYGDIYVMNADGSSTANQITSTEMVSEDQPRWSPDGSTLAYTSSNYVSGTESRDIYVMNADGSGQRPLVADPDGYEWDPSWSPDGRWLTFTGSGGPYGSDRDVFRTLVGGTDITNLTSNSPAADFSGRWSPSALSEDPPSDTSAPVMSLPQGISAQATGPDGARVDFSATATDDLDGPVPVVCASPSGLTSGETFPVGTTLVECRSTDAAGNAAAGSFAVSVVYTFGGFFSPVDNPEVLNKVKAGSAIPINFSLGGNMGLDVFGKAADGSSYPKSVTMACDSTDPVDAIEQTVSAGSSGLTYDAATDRYTYVWKTNKDWTGCRQLVVKLKDGKDYRANFKFVK